MDAAFKALGQSLRLLWETVGNGTNVTVPHDNLGNRTSLLAVLCSNMWIHRWGAVVTYGHKDDSGGAICSGAV